MIEPMTDGEFLASLVEQLEEDAQDAPDDNKRDRLWLAAERLSQIAKKMKQDEKYPAVRP